MKHRQEPAAAGTGLEDALLVGGLLRERRLSRGLAVAQVERAIRFGAQHVLAVEEGRFDKLPPPPYGRGLISAYAALVGLEPEGLLRVCAEALAPAGEGGRPRIFRAPLREPVTWREWTVPFTLAAVVVALVVVRSWIAPAPAELGVPAGSASVSSRPVPASVPAAPAPAPSELSLPPAPDPVEALPPGVRVLLRCEGTTWVDAAADGAEMRRHELGPGQLLELVARERLSLALGDAGVVRVRVGERELGFIGDKGETRTGLTFIAPRPPAAAAARPPAGD